MCGLAVHSFVIKRRFSSNSSELGDKLISSLKEENSAYNMEEDVHVPLDSLDWRKKAGLHQLGFIENTETDTQVCTHQLSIEIFDGYINF